MPKITSVEVTTSTSVMEILGVTVSMVAAMALGTGLLAGMIFTKSPTTSTTASPADVAFGLFALEQSVSPLTAAEIQKTSPGLETVYIQANTNTLRMLNKDGVQLISPVSIGSPVLQQPAVGDIDGDGEAEIIIAPQTTSTLLAFNHDGSPVTGWPVALDQSSVKLFQLADVDANGIVDVVYSTKNTVHMVAGTGQEIRSFSTTDGLSGTTTTTGFDIQDINADGQLDIVTTTQASTIPFDTIHTTVYSLTGSKQTAWNSNGQVKVVYAVNLLRNTPEKEILIPASLFNKETLETTYKIYAFTANGTPLPGWPVDGNVNQVAIGNVVQGISAGVDNPELVVNFGTQISVLQSDGTIAPGWPVTPSSLCAPDSILLQDVQGDVTPEVLVTTKSSTQTGCPITMLSGTGQHVLNSPYAVHASITSYRPPVVADIDGDGKPELLAGATNTNRLVRWEADIPTFARGAQWPQLKQNPTLRPNIPTLCLPTPAGGTPDPTCVGMCTDGSPNHACNGTNSCADGTLLVNGDADNSGQVNITDAVYLINYIFAGGPAPSPMSLGDADGTGQLNITDAVYLINYIFAGGPAPKCPPGSAAVKRAADPTEGMTYEQFKARYPQAFTATEQGTEQL